MTDPALNPAIDDTQNDEAQADTADRPDASSEDARTEEQPQYGVGPFSVREVALVGVWLVAFVISFFSLSVVGFSSLWTSGIDWILTIGLPTVAVFLLVLRRLSPDGIRRVGSLGIDQFASVAFSVSAMIWVQLTWTTVAIASSRGVWAYSWVLWLELVLMLAGVVLTVFAPLTPVLREDFLGRREIPAHRNARPIRPVVAAPPRAPRERRAATSDESVEDDGHGDSAPTDGSLPDGDNRYDAAETGAYATSGDTGAHALFSSDSQDLEGYDAPPTNDTGDWSSERRDADDAAASAPQPTVSRQAFWALSPVERDVVDDRGVPLFRVGPTAWALVIEDHGSMFVIRHEDGRVGYLHDVSDVTRG
ncbi:hypothetical protein [Microbacterium sp. P02]|uniref:hypothetical protein n=1 Tax=Microbacterium sp. P02 TaxID=3366260 RepID=UPI0036715530